VTRTPRLIVAFALIAIGVVIADQVTKVWALSALTADERTPVLGDLLGLTLVRNPGAALSIATGMTWVFTVAAVGVTIVVLRIANRLGSRGWTVALGLLLGGAVGNLIDRLIRDPGVGRGHVVDFIAYGDWFVGNVADIAIVAAACLMGLLGMRGIGVDGGRLFPAAAPEALDADPDARPDADPDTDLDTESDTADTADTARADVDDADVGAPADTSR
jgi:signal peptidase II